MTHQPPTTSTATFEMPTELLVKTTPPIDIASLKSACELGLRAYAAQQTQGETRNDNIHALAGVVVENLRLLRSEVSAVLKKNVAQRWKKWLLGGIIAAIVPAVRKIFRRSAHDRLSSNATEHAFHRSKSLIARILDSIKGYGRPGIASVAFFVLTVLYLFQSEVSVRVARTVSRRLKKLIAKVENGSEELREEDFRVLEGWRWRVLF